MKLIAYQKGADRMMARVQGNEVVPFASLEEFWADPERGLLAAGQARSGGEPRPSCWRKALLEVAMRWSSPATVRA